MKVGQHIDQKVHLRHHASFIIRLVITCLFYSTPRLIQFASLLVEETDPEIRPRIQIFCQDVHLPIL